MQAPQTGYPRESDRGEYRPAGRAGPEDYDRTWGGRGRDRRGPSREEERGDQRARAQPKGPSDRQKGNWSQRRRVNKLGDPATMAVNEMGDPIHMDDEE